MISLNLDLVATCSYSCWHFKYILQTFYCQHCFQLKKLSLEKTRIKEDGALHRFLLSQQCIGQVLELDLQNCEITNQTVKQLGKEIRKRTKPVVAFLQLTITALADAALFSQLKSSY